MYLNDLITNQDIFLKQGIKSKKQLFQELSAKICLSEKLILEKSLFNAIINREKLGNTGIGNGVALPSARVKGLSKVRVILLTLKEPINFHSLDGNDVDIVCLVISPKDFITKHLHCLSKFSRILSDHDVVNRLRGCDNTDSIFAILSSFDLSSAA